MDFDELIPQEEKTWSKSKERKSTMTAEQYAKLETQEDQYVESLAKSSLTKEDFKNIESFQKNLFGSGKEFFTSSNSGINKMKILNEMRTVLELNGVKKTSHTEEVLKNVVLALFG